MLSSLILSSFKYLWKHKGFSLINLIGLSTAICVCFFVLLYIRFEFSYDSYHENADNIYRLVTDIQTSKGVDYQSASAPMGPAIKQSFPDVQQSVRIFLDYMLVQKDESSFNEEKLAYAEPRLSSVITIPLISGSPHHAFDAPFKLVISESIVKQYFGTTDVINQSLILDGKYPAVIGEVV